MDLFDLMKDFAEHMKREGQEVRQKIAIRKLTPGEQQEWAYLEKKAQELAERHEELRAEKSILDGQADLAKAKIKRSLDIEGAFSVDVETGYLYRYEEIT